MGRFPLLCTLPELRCLTSAVQCNNKQGNNVCYAKDNKTHHSKILSLLLLFLVQGIILS